MVCIYCRSSTRVINSRLQKRLNQIWRRRQCDHCKNIFTTHEVTDLSSTLMVQSIDGRLRPFSRDLLLFSVYDSCKHRASAVEDAHALTQTIISNLLKEQTDGIIRQERIVHVTTQALRHFDKAAATIYAAYHPTKNPLLSRKTEWK